MKLDRIVAWLSGMASVVMLCLMTGCVDPAVTNISQADLGGTNALPSIMDILQVGNRITISVTDIPEPRILEETIGDDGYLTLPFNERILAKGKTKGQLQDEIVARYVPKYFQRMTVSIKADDRFFSISGEVRNQTRMLYVGQMTVLKAIAAAGGFTEFAKKTRVYIHRPGLEKPLRVNAARALDNPAKYDVPIYPNDHIEVERRVF